MCESSLCEELVFEATWTRASFYASGIAFLAVSLDRLNECSTPRNLRLT